MKTLFISYCTEYEEGWGSKPDGVLIGKTKEAMEKMIADMYSKEIYEIFWRYDEIKEVTFDDETYNKIESLMNEVAQRLGKDDGLVGVSNKDFKTYNLYQKI